MELFRRHIISRFFWFVLAFHFFNISADTDDMHPYGSPEDLEFNDMESVAEILLEVFLEITDAIPESDEHDNENGRVSLDAVSTFEMPEKVAPSIKNYKLSELCYTSYMKGMFSQFNSEFTPPSPKFV